MFHQSALKIALSIVDQLQPHCELIHIAGSIRRQKPEVKDIEIVCLPKTVIEGVDLFGEGGTLMRSAVFVYKVAHLGKIVKGNAVNGKYMQIELHSDNDPAPLINLDLFIPDAADYYRQYAIRTGSADYAAQVIASGWRKIGWCGVPGIGLRPIKNCYETKDAHGKSTWHCNNPHAAKPPHWQSEQDFFEWIQVPWIEPHLREVK